MFLLVLLPGVLIAVLACAVARLLKEARFDRTVLSVLLVVCAAGWAFSGTQLRGLVMPFTSRMDEPGLSMGALWLFYCARWAILGWPAVPLTVVAMAEYAKRRKKERMLLIPVVMIGICVAAFAAESVWTMTLGRLRINARRDYVRQKQWEESIPDREAHAKAVELLKRQRERALPWRAQHANVSFDGEKLEVITFDRQPRCDLSHLRMSPELKELSVVMTPIEDESLRYLAGVPHLEILTLNSTGTTDMGVQHILQLRELRELKLYNVAVSQRAAIRLQLTNPTLTYLASVAYLDDRESRGLLTTGRTHAESSTTRISRML